jgi:two-component system LytT family response regulator
MTGYWDELTRGWDRSEWQRRRESRDAAQAIRVSRLEARLSGGVFARTHRSFIVNVEKIREVRPTDSSHRVFLLNGAELPLSRSYRESLKSCMAS